MKPSEYLYNEDFMVLNDTYKLKIIDKLDKQFIDREELKKVLKKLSEYYHENWDWPGSVFTEEYNEKILELLK